MEVREKIKKLKNRINKKAVLVALILGLSVVALISYGYRTRRDFTIKQAQDEVFERALEDVRAKKEREYLIREAEEAEAIREMDSKLEELEERLAEEARRQAQRSAEEEWRRAVFEGEMRMRSWGLLE